MLFLDVRSFLIVMTGDGAVKRGWEYMTGEGKLIGLGRAVKKSREGRGQANGAYHCPNLGKKALFPFQKNLLLRSFKKRTHALKYSDLSKFGELPASEMLI